MKGNKSTLRFVVLSALLVLSLVAVTYGARGNVVARVNGVDITQEQFYEVLEQEAGQYVLRQLIIDELINQKQAETGITVTDEEFATVFTQILKQLGGEEGLKQFLAQNRVTQEQLEEQVRWNVLLANLAKAEVEVTETEIQEWFAQYHEYYDQPEQVEASHILVDTEEEANGILNQIKEGADFAELAKEHSLDPGSGPQGGYLGYFGKDMMVEPFEKKAFSLGVNEYGVTESNFGWHVIYVKNRIEFKEATLEDVREDVKNMLLNQKARSAAEYMADLEAQATINILWEHYQN